MYLEYIIPSKVTKKRGGGTDDILRERIKNKIYLTRYHINCCQHLFIETYLY